MTAMRFLIGFGVFRYRNASFGGGGAVSSATVGMKENRFWNKKAEAVISFRLLFPWTPKAEAA
jgi:hypothetical protein